MLLSAALAVVVTNQGFVPVPVLPIQVAQDEHARADILVRVGQIRDSDFLGQPFGIDAVDLHIAVAASVCGCGRERAFGLNDAQSHVLRDAVFFADRNQMALQVEVQRNFLMQIALLQQSGLDFLVLVRFLYGFRFLSRLSRHLDRLVCTVVLCSQ